MHILVSRGFWVSVFCSFALVLVGCGGGGSSSSGGGGVALNSSMVVQGNVSNVSGSARVDFETGQGPIMLAKSFARHLISDAQAQATPLVGIMVCIEDVCDITDVNGRFILNVESLSGGTYTIRFSTPDGASYEAVVDLRNYSITELEGVLLMEGDQVRITNVRVTNLQPPAEADDEEEEGEGEEEEPTVKVEVCHQPGTPAEKTLRIPESALGGHLGHGDYEGVCNPNVVPISTE